MWRPATNTAATKTWPGRRALLQRRLRDEFPALYNSSAEHKLRTSAFKPFEEGAFASYVHGSLLRAGVEPPSAGEEGGVWPTAAALEQEWEREWTAQAGRLRLFHLMREALAPLVEAVLLVDRALFLTQQLGEGAVVRLFPVFDPGLRCADTCSVYFTPVACCS